MALGEHASRYQPAEAHKRTALGNDYERFGSPTTADGFSGILAGRIAEWNKKGLGRAIGYQVASDSRWEEPTFNGIMFVLPLNTEKDFAKRALLIIPHHETVVFKIVKPKQSNNFYREDREFENTNYLGEFSSLFEPSTIPFALQSWKPKKDSTPQYDFLNALLQTHSFVVERDISGEEKEKTLNTALHIAVKEEAARVASDEHVLADLLGDSVGKDLSNVGIKLDMALSAQAKDRAARLRRVSAIPDERISTVLAGLDFEPEENV